MGPLCPAASYRFVVLLFNCLLTFGSYFCFDIPSVLQQQFQGVSAGRARAAAGREGGSGGSSRADASVAGSVSASFPGVPV